MCRLVRWTQTLKELGEQRIQLMGDCLLSSAFLCYVGAFTWDFRNQLVYTDWQADLRDRLVPMSQPFRLEAVLTDDVEISKYATGWAGCKNGSGCYLMPSWINGVREPRWYLQRTVIDFCDKSYHDMQQTYLSYRSNSHQS